jgi:hypothetical protein
MTGPEIFTKIQVKKALIEDLIDPTAFVLNPEIAALEEEINELQNQCNHNYVEGVCEYCGKEEE